MGIIPDNYYDKYLTTSESILEYVDKCIKETNKDIDYDAIEREIKMENAEDLRTRYKQRLLMLYSSDWNQDSMHILHSPDRRLTYTRDQIYNMSDEDFEKILSGIRVWVSKNQ